MPKEEINRLIVSDILQSSFAVSTEEGEALFNRINSFISQNKKVELDFKDIKLIVSTFLNASIGQLYGLYTTEIIQDHLSIVNMTQDDLAVLKKVTDRAKEYFKDKKGLEELFKKHFPDAE